MDSVQCSFCKQPVGNTAKFCPYCGKPISSNVDENNISNEIIMCSKCGGEILNWNKFCPNCGCPVDSMHEQSNNLDNQISPDSQTAKHKRNYAILISVTILICLLFFMNNSSKNAEIEQEINTDTPKGYTSQSSSPKQNFFDNSTLEFEHMNPTIFSEVWNVGVYKCGIDIEPGEYYLLAINGGRSFYGVSNSSDNFPYIGNGVVFKISLEEKQYINVRHGMILACASDVEDKDWTELGVFLVGKDLPAGEYTIEKSTNGSDIAGYQIFDGQPGINAVSGDIISEGKKYITVKDGQYLALCNAKSFLVEEAEASTSVTIEKPDVPQNTEPSQETDTDKYKNFEKSSAYLAAKSVIEDTLQTLDPRMEYKENSRTVYVYLDAPEGTAFYLLTSKSSVADTWNTMSENLCGLSESISSMIHGAGYEIDCIFYFLSDYNPDNSLLTVRNGNIIYNVIDE